MQPYPIYPVVWAVPADKQQLSGRARVDFLRAYARQAVRRSARYSGSPLTELPVGENRAPLPAGGLFWSLSHKPGCVAGVVARHPVGIDVETVRPVAARVFKRVLDASELQLAGADADPALWFFRCWTAKEVVLKQAGIGLAGISQCRVRAVADERCLVVDYKKKRHVVAQAFFNQHVAAVLQTAGERVHWCLGPPEQVDSPAGEGFSGVC